MSQFYEPEILHRVQQMELDILQDIKKLCEEHHLILFGIAGTGIGAIRHRGFIPWDDDIDVAMPRRDFEKLLTLVEQERGAQYYILNWKTSENYPLMTTRICKKGTRFVDSHFRGIDCPFGVFLDMYVLDNVPDQPILMKVQAWQAWFVSKLLILRSIPRPYLAQTGWMAGGITAICIVVHNGMKYLHISKRGLASTCERICRRYEGKKTSRMAFLPDTNPYWNVVEKSGLKPLEIIEFEGIALKFPNTIRSMLTYMYGDFMELPPVERRKTHYPWILDLGDGLVMKEGVVTGDKESAHGIRSGEKGCENNS